MLSMLYVLLLGFVLSSDGAPMQPADRYLRVSGTARARGAALGRALQPRIQALYSHRRQELLAHAATFGSEVPARFEANWTSLALASQSAMQKYTPVWFEELSGMVDAGVPLNVLLRLSTEYEAEMMLLELDYGKMGTAPTTSVLPDRVKSGHCSGAATLLQKGGSSELLTGQSNDENVQGWLNGSTDVVVHSIATDKDMKPSLQALYYTHPGMGAYMGMNSAGLTVLWQLIDDGSRSNNYTGVPTTAVLRELLTFEDAEQAAQWLCRLPMAIPNNFMLSADGRAGQILKNVERPAAAEACNIVSQSLGYLAHTNHVVYDHDMIDNDIFLRFSRLYETTHETEDRLRAVLAGLRKLVGTENVTFRGLQELYSMHPLLNVETLATMFFAPRQGQMRIRFFEDGTTAESFRGYCFDGATGSCQSLPLSTVLV